MIARALTGALLVLVPLVAGIFLGGHPDALPDPVRNVLVDDREGRVLDEALGVIEDDYYRPVNRKRVVNDALTAAVDSLRDRFSAYFDPSAYRHFQEATEGEFEGVGMTVDAVRQGLRIATVIEGSPAAVGGLRAGDLITHVDGKALRGRNVTESTGLIKGRAGTKVTLRIRRGGLVRNFALIRRRVQVEVVRAAMRRHRGVKVAHVRLSSFTSGAHGQVSKRMNSLLKRGAQGVVLDLRDNGGGLLNEAVLVSSLFVADGTIVTTRGRSRPEQVFEAQGKSIAKNLPVVVLVDGETASASEIVAGALRDRQRAKVVGTRTFGKGVFQEITRLSNGGALDLTVGEYFTPSGRNLGPRAGRPGGIEPDIRALDDRETRTDEALNVALRTVVRGVA